MDGYIDTRTIKLKRCPFCGREPRMYKNRYNGEYYTECTGAGEYDDCCITDKGAKAPEEDAEGWNKRTSDEKYGHMKINPYWHEKFPPEEGAEALAADVLPCPWCGKYPVIAFVDGGYSIDCNTDDCPIRPEGLGNTLAEAVADWNRRPKEG